MRKTRSHTYITGPEDPLWHIHTLFCVSYASETIFSGKVFCGKLAELPHTPTCFISCWEKVKEVWGVISIVVWCQEFYESTCKRNPITFSHGDLPERHSWFYAWWSRNCKSSSLSQHMLFSALFAYMVVPVLRLDALSHFLMFIWEKIRGSG